MYGLKSEIHWGIALLLALLPLAVAGCGGGGSIKGDTIPIHGITDGGISGDPFDDFDPALVIPDPEVFQDLSSPTDTTTVKWVKNFYDPLPPTDGPVRVFQNASLMNWSDRILMLVNNARATRGLAPLKREPHLERMAQAHARDMALRDFFDHVNPYGMRPMDRFNALNPPNYNHAGENAARGQENTEELVQQWLASEKHAANIFNPAYTHTGIGAYFNKNKPAIPSNFIQFFAEFYGDPAEYDEWYPAVAVTQ
jgi:uncharacterized protein YkwD